MLKKHFIHSLYPLLVLTWAIILLLTTQQELLFAAQDLSGWQPDFIFGSNSHFYKGLLFWVAGYLTQTFYYPWLGVSILCVLWWIGYQAVVWGLRLDKSLRWLALLPIFGLVAGIAQTGYWVYTLRHSGYFFIPTLYYFGIGVFFSILRFVIVHRKSILLSCIGGIILLNWLFILSPWDWFSWHPFDGGSSMLARPWYFSAITFFVAILCSCFRNCKIPYWLSSVSLVSCMLVTFFFSCYRNQNFRAELQQQTYFENAKWSDIINTVVDSPRTSTRHMILLADAARMHRDYHLGDSITFKGNNGVKPRQYSDPPIHLAQIAGPTIYLAFGYVNYSYRWAFENSVEYGFSPQRLRLMSYCALLKGETALVRKYADMLYRFPFHREVARRLLAFIDKNESIAQDALLGQLQQWMLQEDALTFDSGKPEKFLLQNLPQSHHITWYYDISTELVFY